MHYLPRKEGNKVIAFNINWLLFSGSVLVIMALVLFSNLHGSVFNRLSCQVCLLLATVVLVIHSIHFWFSNWLMFVCHLIYDSLYLLTAICIANHAYLDAVYVWVVLAYLLLGSVRLYSYCRIRGALANVDKDCDKHEVLGLTGWHDRSLKRAWYAMLLCGVVDWLLVIAMLWLPITESHLLVVVSIDMFVSGLVFFRLGLVL